MNKYWIIILINFLGTVPYELYSENLEVVTIDTDKRFIVRKVYDIRNIYVTNSDVLKLTTGISLPEPRFIRDVFDNTLELSGVKADSIGSADYNIDLLIEDYEWSKKSWVSGIYTTFFKANNDSPLITVRIFEKSDANTKKTFYNVTEATIRKFIDEVNKVANLSSQEIRELSLREEYQPIFIDTILLASISDLKVKKLNIIKWIADSLAVVSWKTYVGPHGVSKVLYKLSSKSLWEGPPESNWDTTGTLNNISPDTISINKEDSLTLYLWVVDGLGNVNYKDAISTKFTYNRPFKPEELFNKTGYLGLELTGFPIPTSVGRDRSIVIPGNNLCLASAFIGMGVELGGQFLINKHLAVGIIGGGKFRGSLAEESDWEHTEYDSGQQKCTGASLMFKDLGINLYTQKASSNYLWNFKSMIGGRFFESSGELTYEDSVTNERRIITKDNGRFGVSCGGEILKHISIKSVIPFSIIAGYQYYPFFDNLNKINVGIADNFRINFYGTQSIISAGLFFELYKNDDILCASLFLKLEFCSAKEGD